MATLKQIDELVLGAPNLLQRFRAARLKASWDIQNEDPGTTGHAQRLVWANGIIDDYDGANLNSEYRLFLSNTTIQTDGEQSTDNDIIFVVNSFINVWAGV